MRLDASAYNANQGQIKDIEMSIRRLFKFFFSYYGVDMNVHK